MRALLLCLMIGYGTAFAQSPASSPLNEAERRLVLGQLYELKACRELVLIYRDYISRESEQDAREKANYERALDLERQATAIASKERDLAQDKASFYKQAYEGLTRKRSLGCVLKRIFTAGLARCR